MFEYRSDAFISITLPVPELQHKLFMLSGASYESINMSLGDEHYLSMSLIDEISLSHTCAMSLSQGKILWFHIEYLQIIITNPCFLY